MWHRRVHQPTAAQLQGRQRDRAITRPPAWPRLRRFLRKPWNTLMSVAALLLVGLLHNTLTRSSQDSGAMLVVGAHATSISTPNPSSEVLDQGGAGFTLDRPNARLGAATWHISKQQASQAVFGGTGVYTDEAHSFDEVLNLADFWIFHPALAPGSADPESSSATTTPHSEGTVAVPRDPANVDGSTDLMWMRWTLVPHLGADDPLANSTTDPAIDRSVPSGRTGALTWATIRRCESCVGHRFVQDLWMFGGKGYTSSGDGNYLNDLWRLTVPVVNETTDLTAIFSSLRWEHIQGHGTPADNSGDPVFGNYSDAPHDEASLSAWPGAREHSVTWTKNNNLWLFGGLGFGAVPLGEYDFSAVEGHFGYMNDIWEFDTALLLWVWRGGSSLPHVYGIYATSGNGTVLSPGGRTKSAAWVSSSSNQLFLFGGYGFAEAGGAGYLNDLWKIELDTLQWEWVGGRRSRPNEAGSYEGWQVWPGGRAGAASISVPRCSSAALFFLFGGYGYGSDSVFQGRLSDRWLFNTSSISWTLLGGATTTDEVTTYAASSGSGSGGLPFVSESDNGKLSTLGGRAYTAMWRFAPVDVAACVDGEIETMSTLLFGGGGYRSQDQDASGSAVTGPAAEFRNDLWLVQVDVHTSSALAAALGSIVLTLGIAAATGVVVCCCCNGRARRCVRADACCRFRRYDRVFDVL